MIKIHHFFPIPKKRFKGGITHLAEFLIENWQHDSFHLNPVNTYIFQPSARSMGRFSLAGLGNMCWIACKLLLTKKHEIIHFHTSKKNGLLKDLLAIRIAEIFNQQKLFLHIHFSDLENTLPTFLKNWTTKQLRKKRIICLTKKMEQDLIKCGIHQNRITYLPNFYRTNDSLEERKEEKTICFVGSIDERKEIFPLVESLQNIHDRKLVLHVCGMPSNKKMAKKWANTKKESKIKIIDHGYLATKDLYKILSQTRFFVLPSKNEGMPLSSLDAMALGCVCFFSELDYIHDINPEKKILNYFLPDNWRDFENQLNSLLNNTKIVKEKSRNTRNLAKSFSFENFSNSLLSLYQSINLSTT